VEGTPHTWPLHDQLVKLQSYNPEEIGLTRMGVGLSFSGTELQVSEIASMLNDVRLDWRWLSPNPKRVSAIPSASTHGGRRTEQGECFDHLQPSEHVTILERVLSPSIDRLRGS
jgi:hypothetical protein